MALVHKLKEDKLTHHANIYKPTTMSSPNFNINQSVKVTKDSNHIKASDIVYKIACLDRIMGSISAVLSLEGKVVGSVSESCLEASK